MSHTNHYLDIFSMVLLFPPRTYSNDNMDIWTQGLSDGCSDIWADHLANENGHLGTIYVAGWLSGREKAASISDYRNFEKHP